MRQNKSTTARVKRAIREEQRPEHAKIVSNEVHHLPNRTCSCCHSRNNRILFVAPKTLVDDYPVLPGEQLCKRCFDKRSRLAAEAAKIEDTGLTAATANT